MPDPLDEGTTTINEWERDCMHWRGKILNGVHGHWCPEWDYLTIDETCPEWPCGCSVSDKAEKEQGE